MSNDNDKVKGQARKEVEEALEKVAHPQAKGFWIDWKRILTPIISKALETHLRRIEELEKDKSEQVTTQMHERGKLIKRITEFEEVLEQCKRWHDGDKWRFDKNPERRKDWERQRDFINQALSPKQGECDE